MESYTTINDFERDHAEILEEIVDTMDQLQKTIKPDGIINHSREDLRDAARVRLNQKKKNGKKPGKWTVSMLSDETTKNLPPAPLHETTTPRGRACKGSNGAAAGTRCDC